MKKLIILAALICMAGCSTDNIEGNGLLHPVKEDGEWGYIDQQGKYVIDPQYDHAYGFSEGLAHASIDGLWGYIDRTGEFVIEPQFNGTSTFSGGLARVEIDDEWGFINETVEIVIAPRYEYIDAS